jgi:hypothetical protein
MSTTDRRLPDRPSRLIARLLPTALAALLAACASAPAGFRYQVPADESAKVDKYIAPEAASGYTEKPGWSTKRFARSASRWPRRTRWPPMPATRC